jgi:hypothetical protein
MEGRPKPLVTLLRLGRVSNLATVWTNVLAATVVAGGSWANWRTAIVVLAMSLFYLGGMYLNDYFDRAIDARERPERPIPAGHISAAAVAAIGSGLLGLGIALTAPFGLLPIALSLVLVAAVIWYDIFHKETALCPVVMGACRALTYGVAAAAVTGTVSATIVVMALSLLAYVAGLTYAARQESFNRVGNLWPLLVLSAPIVIALPALRHGPVAVALYLILVAAVMLAIYFLSRRPVAGAVSYAVGLLIAAISLVDAALMASVGAIGPAVLASTGFGWTLLLQKHIPGT